MRLLLIAAFIAPTAAHSQGADEAGLVKNLFATLNPLSIREGVEFCGYVGYDFDGRLVASAPNRGSIDSCLPDDPAEIEIITASYHTHGGFSRDYFNEVPSGDDMEGDADEGIDGWVATPGGRLWYIDTVDMVASQICGIGCLPADPRFVAGDMGHVAASYAYEDLVILMEE